jgi:hypothetical protein
VEQLSDGHFHTHRSSSAGGDASAFDVHRINKRVITVWDPGLVQLKADSLMDPLRKGPRFQAIERELKSP